MRGKSIKNCSFANCFITLMGQSPIYQLSYAYTYTSISLLAKAGNHDGSNLYYICVTLDRPRRLLHQRGTSGSGRSDLHA